MKRINEPTLLSSSIFALIMKPGKKTAVLNNLAIITKILNGVSQVIEPDFLFLLLFCTHFFMFSLPAYNKANIYRLFECRISSSFCSYPKHHCEAKLRKTQTFVMISSKHKRTEKK